MIKKEIIQTMIEKSKKLGKNYITKLIPIKLVVPNKSQPRKFFNEKKLNELASSIKENGIIQPILVAKLENNDNYEIIAGERRWRASMLLNMQEIPAIVYDIDENQKIEISIIENIQRENLNSIEEGEAYKLLIDKFSYTHDKVSKIVGKSRSHITNTLRLLTLPNNIKKLIINKLISSGHAKALVGSENAEEIANIILEKNLSVRKAEKIVKEYNKNNIKKYFKKSKSNIELEEIISNSLNLNVKIEEKDETGKVIIHFSNVSELEMILTKLSNCST